MNNLVGRSPNIPANPVETGLTGFQVRDPDGIFIGHPQGKVTCRLTRQRISILCSARFLIRIKKNPKFGEIGPA